MERTAQIQEDPRMSANPAFNRLQQSTCIKCSPSTLSRLSVTPPGFMGGLRKRHTPAIGQAQRRVLNVDKQRSRQKGSGHPLIHDHARTQCLSSIATAELRTSLPNPACTRSRRASDDTFSQSGLVNQLGRRRTSLLNTRRKVASRIRDKVEQSPSRWVRFLRPTCH